MKTHKRFLLLLADLTAILLLASACGVNVANSAQSAPPLQVLQKSYSAMKQLKTAHFTMQIAEQLNMGSGSSTNLTISANGAEILPDKADVHLTEPGMSLSAITLGREMYMQNSKGQWYVLQNQAESSAGNPFSGTSISSYASLLELASKAHFVDHGMQELDGQSLRHITVTLDKNALQQIINTTLGSSLGGASASSMSQLLNMLNMKNTTLDLWIDPATYYVHQMELKYTMSINTSSFITPTPSTSTSYNISVGSDTTIEMSDFNAPVTITAPSNAIPTNNLSSVFGAGEP
jgi:hypothetical protein